ncbi:phosphodiester glycosidase family protein [Pelomonas sp. P8]|uniref:Phosphodiester glycosidase family protein n=2 Tax=Pelomonas cellulosilytica TaxID=2906762 RepID=A0ABS8XY68_9BURK|nr:phosphodiester glycosidase family protein [Pelomonas sp. P8]MCE4557591.1 phosphodiester glycosidase family protein [Pelomonas sp. P8]
MLLAGLTLTARADGEQGEGRYTVVRIEAAQLRLVWLDDRGRPLRRLDRLAAWLEEQGHTLSFGMNAGMFHGDGGPVGLLVIDGREMAPLNLDDGAGNFFLKPNGVFFVDVKGPHVVDAADFPRGQSGVRLATQSGPLLLKGGEMHPALRPSSASRYVRNGVCALGSQAVFVISERPVTFHEFASFLRDELQCRDALYLDGSVSSLHSPALGRDDHAHELGPMFAVIE